MKLARKEDQMWHFANPDHCGWAQTFVEQDSFEEELEVSSTDEVGELCSMCRERRAE